METKVSYGYLVRVFLKVGSVSFGGFMALISVLQREVVEKDKSVKDEAILDGISLASILPGPLAVNTVCYLGYQLKGFWGAMVSMAAVIFPSFVLMVVFTAGYYEFGQLQVVNHMLAFIMPAIVAIVLTVGINMHVKHVKDFRQYAIALGGVLILQFIGGIMASLLVIGIGALLGVWLYRDNGSTKVDVGTKGSQHPWLGLFVKNSLKVLGLIGLLLASCFFLDTTGTCFFQNVHIAGVFSGMSLTLFGGGYVIIPLIQEAIVGELGWLGVEDFNTAIALSQVTPGPILVSATFIGYKLGGLLGATIATISIFLPSGLLMLLLSHSMDRVKNSRLVVAAFKGLRPAIVGLIYAAAITIGVDVLSQWFLIVQSGILVFLILKYKISSLLAILGSAVVGGIALMI